MRSHVRPSPALLIGKSVAAIPLVLAPAFAFWAVESLRDLPWLFSALSFLFFVGGLVVISHLQDGNRPWQAEELKVFSLGQWVLSTRLLSRRAALHRLARESYFQSRYDEMRTLLRDLDRSVKKTERRFPKAFDEFCRNAAGNRMLIVADSPMASIVLSQALWGFGFTVNDELIPRGPTSLSKDSAHGGALLQPHAIHPDLVIVCLLPDDPRSMIYGVFAESKTVDVTTLAEKPGRTLELFKVPLAGQPADFSEAFVRHLRRAAAGVAHMKAVSIR